MTEQQGFRRPLIVRLRPLQNLHLWHISSLCAARKLAYLSDMSALSALL
ncbi:lipoprotein signal peptidase [Neisseria sp. N95_16]|nr:lipoprotein signal peptidase [Neisseria sp. N95_16]PJO79066.1 lipoprotein signal peptidase [Neisseria sp. N177_16]